MNRGSGWLLVSGMLGGCLVPNVDEFREERTQGCGQSFTCPEGLHCQDGFCVGLEPGSELCMPLCAAHQVCAIPSRSCVSRYSKLTLLEPKSGARLNFPYNSTNYVLATAELQLVEGAAASYPKALRFTLSAPGQVPQLNYLSPQGGRFSAWFTPKSEGEYTFTVTHDDSGLHDSATFSVQFGSR